MTQAMAITSIPPFHQLLLLTIRAEIPRRVLLSTKQIGKIHTTGVTTPGVDPDGVVDLVKVCMRVFSKRISPCEAA